MGPGMSAKRVVAPVALLAAVATGVLTGCGGNDAVASSTPELGLSPSSEPTGAEGAAGPGGDVPDGDPQASPTGAVVPDDGGTGGGDTDGGGNVASSDGRASYLAALNDRGITYDGNGDIAVGTATYICTALAEGASPDQIRVLATAMVAQEALLTGATEAPEAATGTYIEVAKAHYC